MPKTIVQAGMTIPASSWCTSRNAGIAIGAYEFATLNRQAAKARNAKQPAHMECRLGFPFQAARAITCELCSPSPTNFVAFRWLVAELQKPLQ
jgi:hypothetical protein